MNLNSLEIENNKLPLPKILPDFTTNFSANMFLFGVRKKTFALRHFLTPKNCILEAFWKQISVYFCIFLYI